MMKTTYLCFFNKSAENDQTMMGYENKKNDSNLLKGTKQDRDGLWSVSSLSGGAITDVFSKLKPEEMVLLSHCQRQ